MASGAVNDEVVSSEFTVDPLGQFVIKPLFIELKAFSFDLSFTNSSLWLSIACISSFLFLFLGSRRKLMVPNRLQALVEVFYNLISSMVKQNIGKKGEAFFPIIFTLFMLIFFTNMVGLIPQSFTATSHVAVTLTLAIFVIGMVVIVGFYNHGLGFFKLFTPSGVPLIMLFIVAPIEFFSFIARIFSLSIRLFANMFAGHAVIKVFASFLVMFNLFALPVIPLLSAFYAFELFVAFIQSYIFIILTCIYLNDAINMHH